MPRPTRRPISTQSHSIGRQRARPLGAHGQHTIDASGPYTYVSEWPDAPAGGGTLLLDWGDGDGAVPRVWGGAPLTPAGVITAGVGTPWGGVTASNFAALSSYTSADARLDPGTDDRVIVCLFRVLDAGVDFLCATLNSVGANIGWTLRTLNGITVRVIVRDHLGASVTRDYPACIQKGTWTLAIAVLDKDSLISLYIGANNTPVTIAMPGGMIDSTNGFGINANNAGTNSGATEIARVRVYGGANIAPVWNGGAVAFMQRSILGIQPASGPAPTFSRASMASHVGSDGRLYLSSLHMPRCGDAGGLRSESAQTNKARRTVNPPDAAIWTASGAPAAAIVADAAALAAAKISSLAVDGSVYRYNNNSGATRYIYDSNAACRTGNVNRHSLSIFAKYAAGANAELGWWDISAGAFTSAGVILGAYARTKWPNLVPPDTDCVLAIKILNGTDLYWIGHQCEERWHCSSHIPVWSVVGSETRAADDYDINNDANDDGGSIVLTAAPLGWSGNPGVTQSLVSVGATDMVTVQTDSDVRSADGTTTVDAAGTVFADATDNDVRVSWGGPGQYVDSDGNVAVGAYDGTLPAGTMALGQAATGSYAWAVKRLMITLRWQAGGPPW